MGQREGTATARPLRIEHDGASCHVLNQGNARPRVSPAHDDSALFPQKVAPSDEPLRVSPRALCLLPNRFHLCIPAPEANLPPFSDPGPLLAEPCSHAPPSCPRR